MFKTRSLYFPEYHVVDAVGVDLAWGYVVYDVCNIFKGPIDMDTLSSIVRSADAEYNLAESDRHLIHSRLEDYVMGLGRLEVE